MPKHSARLSSILPHARRGRAPLTGVEVRDSSWDEWNEAVSEFGAFEEGPPTPQPESTHELLRRKLAALLTGRG